LPLRQFSFRLGDGIGFEFDAGVADDALLWRVARLDAPPHYIIAIGVKTGGIALPLGAKRVVPLNQMEGPT
jgi:hypothetical protein